MTKKKLTLNDLISKKEQLNRNNKEKKKQELYLEQLDAIVTIEEPDIALVSESGELASDKNYEGNSDDYLVYNILVDPNLKDPELQKAYDCTEPTDIVSAIFDIGTVAGIAKEGLRLAGFESQVKQVDELKN